MPPYGSRRRPGFGQPQNRIDMGWQQRGGMTTPLPGTDHAPFPAPGASPQPRHTPPWMPQSGGNRIDMGWQQNGPHTPGSADGPSLFPPASQAPRHTPPWMPAQDRGLDMGWQSPQQRPAPIGVGNSPFPVPGQGGWGATMPGATAAPNGIDLGWQNTGAQTPADPIPGNRIDLGWQTQQQTAPGVPPPTLGAFGMAVPGATGAQQLQEQSIAQMPPQQRDALRQLMAQGVPYMQAYQQVMQR